MSKKSRKKRKEENIKKEKRRKQALKEASRRLQGLTDDLQYKEHKLDETFLNLKDGDKQLHEELVEKFVVDELLYDSQEILINAFKKINPANKSTFTNMINEIDVNESLEKLYKEMSNIYEGIGEGPLEGYEEDRPEVLQENEEKVKKADESIIKAFEKIEKTMSMRRQDEVGNKEALAFIKNIF